MSQSKSFRETLHQSFNTFIKQQEELLNGKDYIKIDLHCHDHNSSVPDEQIGRILNVPETWLTTESLVKTLEKQQTDLITITNHNNAISCFDLRNKGKDVLVGAEFTCRVPEYNVSIHVLAYGFDENQETHLNQLRPELYQFLSYCKEEEIPTIWAHPLYFYSPGGIPPMDFFHKMVLVFERFEVINGQRDTWQNMLVKVWIESYSKQQLDALSEKYGIDPRVYCRDSYAKTFFAGSDSHMGLFAGTTGSYLLIENLSEKIQNTPLSILAKEAILNGKSAVYGTYQNSEKLTFAFLDYFLQIALYKDDPGMLRIILHKGNPQDKLISLFISNAITELQYHKMTMRFIRAFHQGFRGKKNIRPQRFVLSQSYRNILSQASHLAKAANLSGDDQLSGIKQTIDRVYEQLSKLFFQRLEKKIEYLKKSTNKKGINPQSFIAALDMPADFRHYFHSSYIKSNNSSNQNNLIRFLNGLSFPFLASNLLLAAEFASAKVLFNNRKLLNQFAETLGRFQPPKRILWLSDSFDDKNGVAMVLKSILKEVQELNLPIDFLICSKNIQPDSHLFVIKPQLEFNTALYPDQAIRIPDMKQIHSIFQNGEYDQIICSTEGYMGFAALYLKNAFTVPASFYMHTDWMQFAKDSGKMNRENLSKLRRILREFYRQFDSVFVLNSEHRLWLESSDMMIDPKKIYQTAHWVDEYFVPKANSKKELFGSEKDDLILLFSGRLSREKGLIDLTEIYKGLKNRVPNLKLVFAGSGPMEKELKELLPEATFLGWIEHDKMPEIYSSADLLILPSRFDTFSVVVLEAMSCGLPVAAYHSKGPKEIIQNNSNGFLAKDIQSMINQITLFFLDPELKNSILKNTIKRAQEFDKKTILTQFMKDLSPIA